MRSRILHVEYDMLLEFLAMCMRVCRRDLEVSKTVSNDPRILSGGKTTQSTFRATRRQGCIAFIGKVLAPFTKIGATILARH